MISAKLEKLDAREKAFLVAAVVVLLAVPVDYVVIHGITKRIGEIDRQIVLRRDELKLARHELSRRPAVEAAYQAASGLIGVATRKSEEIDKMKGQIDELAERAGIGLDTIDHRQPKESLFYDEYFVEIGKLETDMQNLLKFLRSIEELDAPGMIRVTKLNITPSKTKGVVKGSMVISKVMTSSSIEEE